MLTPLASYVPLNSRGRSFTVIVSIISIFRPFISNFNFAFAPTSPGVPSRCSKLSSPPSIRIDCQRCQKARSHLRSVFRSLPEVCRSCLGHLLPSIFPLRIYLSLHRIVSIAFAVFRDIHPAGRADNRLQISHDAARAGEHKRQAQQTLRQ